MRIVYIAAGAGVMYCGACARDITLVKGLMDLGHDVEIVPLYTPLRPDTDDAPETSPVFFGGVNVFLQQSVPLFRGLPKFLDRWLDNSSLLRLVSRFAINTSASSLGPMTVSVLSGRQGNQLKELERLLDYLEANQRPDVISITNSMLSAIAPEIKSRLNVPVVCSLQGEEAFIDSMPEHYARKSRQLMQQHAEYIDVYTAPGKAYAEKMAEYLAVDSSKIAVVPAGVDLSTYTRKTKYKHSPARICYLSVIAEPKGLDLLVQAFARMQDKSARLVVAGRVMNKQFYEKIRRDVLALGVGERIDWLGEVDLDQKLQLLESCSVFVLPSRISESRGMVVLEAMALGLPVIVPESGIFPELIGKHGSGIMFKSEDKQELTCALDRLVSDSPHALQLSSSARSTVSTHFSSQAMTKAAADIYEKLIR